LQQISKQGLIRMKQKQKPLSFSLHPDNHAYIEAVVNKQKETNHRYNRSMYMDDLITHLRTKAKPAKKAKTELATLEVEGLNTDAWDKWLAYRKLAKLKAYKTNAKKKELATLGNFEEQMQIVMISINNEYAGLFPLKNNGQDKVDILKKSADSDWHLQDQGF